MKKILIFINILLFSIFSNVAFADLMVPWQQSNYINSLDKINSLDNSLYIKTILIIFILWITIIWIFIYKKRKKAKKW